MKETLTGILASKLNITTAITAMIKLHGDASYRTYFRIHLADGRTFIAMQLPVGRTSASEEITNVKGETSELPFINVARFLREKGIPVPTVYHYSVADRLVILEDVGDRLFLGEVTNTPVAKQCQWYHKAVVLLVQMQTATRAAKSTDCIALQRSFDETLLNWEFDHFLEYGLKARGVKMAAHDETLFTTATRNMSRAIGALPHTFTHRDFQSKNLMVRGETLVLLDFQDALLGPAVYDLVALLRDSYIALADPLVAELIAAYAEQTHADHDTVQRQFHLVTIQRKLKDAGRFVYIDQVKGNQNFLQYIPLSLKYVHDAFQKLPEYGVLYHLLKKYLPEWKR